MIPEKYKWLESLSPLPKLVDAGLQYLGLKEVPGAASNPVILAMAKDLGIADIYTNDDVSWCAVFISFLCKKTGKPLPDIKGDRYNLMRASWFEDYGQKADQPMLGDILVFQRPGGSHVGLYIGESTNTYHVLGGNQSNAVTITEIQKHRLRAARRYYHSGLPSTVRKYNISASGVISKNEA